MAASQLRYESFDTGKVLLRRSCTDGSDEDGRRKSYCVMKTTSQNRIIEYRVRYIQEMVLGSA